MKKETKEEKFFRDAFLESGKGIWNVIEEKRIQVIWQKVVTGNELEIFLILDEYGLIFKSVDFLGTLHGSSVGPPHYKFYLYFPETKAWFEIKLPEKN